MTRDANPAEKIAITKALTLLQDAKRPIPDFTTVDLENLHIEDGWLIKYRNGRARTRVHLEYSLIPETQQEQDERLQRDKGPGFGLPLGAPDPLMQRSALKLAVTKSRSKFIDMAVKEGDKKTISPRTLLQRAKRPTATPSPPARKRATSKSTLTKRGKAPAKSQQTIDPLRQQPTSYIDMAAIRSISATEAVIATSFSAIPDPTLQEVLRLLAPSQPSLRFDRHSKSPNMHDTNHLHDLDPNEEDIERPTIEPIIVTDLHTIQASSPDPQLALQSTAKGHNMNTPRSPALLEVFRLLSSLKADDVQQARSRTIQSDLSAQAKWTFEESKASVAILKQDIWREYPVESVESSLDKQRESIAGFVEPIEGDDEPVNIADVGEKTRIDTPTDPVETKADTEVDVNLIASILAGMKDGEILQPVA